MRFLVVFLACGTALSFAGERDTQLIKKDYSLILKARGSSESNQYNQDKFTLKNSSEIKTAASGLIRLYQILISSQDSPACNFSPTCSRFTSSAIQKAGIIKGTLLGADRLLRCHRWTKRQYMKANNLLPDQMPEHIDDPPGRYIH